MSLTVTPVQDDLYRLVKALVVTVTGLDPSLVIKGLPNRTAMPPASPGFVTMQATTTKRLRTNQEVWDLTDPDPSSIDTEQGTQLRMQLDCYGAASGDWAVMLCTVLRSDYGCVQLAGTDPTNPVVVPLYASDESLSPLDDSEAQYEERWTLEAILQYNPVTTVPAQFADTLTVTLINVDETFPP